MTNSGEDRNSPSARRDLFRAGVAAMLGGLISESATRSVEAASSEPPGKSDRVLRMPAHYYQQFDADLARDVPAEAYGGWKTAMLDFPLASTALVVMHAWDCGTSQEFPGWFRAVEYIPRADVICRTVFPGMLGTAREQGLRVFHVVGGGDYYKEVAGYRRAIELAGPSPAAPEQIQEDAGLKALRQFRSENVFMGRRNADDARRGFARLDFAREARPLDSEGVAENGHQLFALCKHHEVNHLIYAGFAINWCLLMSPGGMLDMSQRGLMCSAIRQATTAVENRESARSELAKELALWRVALAFGFVFDNDTILSALRKPLESPANSPAGETGTPDR